MSEDCHTFASHPFVLDSTAKVLMAGAGLEPPENCAVQCLSWLDLSPCSNGPSFLPGVIGLVSIVSKGCDSSCESHYQDFKIGNRNISCCSSDLCNVNAAGSVRSKVWGPCTLLSTIQDKSSAHLPC
uniref:Snake toxin/toxin-like domain-containing protein n=1 Tax=Amazona collaria TaxID=241587 RepID=A0A8B9EWZ4_9PSIT